jgi:hypothetical protein
VSIEPQKKGELLHIDELAFFEDDPVRDCGFYPDLATVRKLSHDRLTALFISQVDWGESGYLNYLTFVFSNGARSPPIDSYKEEPGKSFLMPKGAQIHKFDFGVKHQGDIVSCTLKD